MHLRLEFQLLDVVIPSFYAEGCFRGKLGEEVGHVKISAPKKQEEAIFKKKRS
jgi:hypothetical protein